MKELQKILHSYKTNLKYEESHHSTNYPIIVLQFTS